MKKIVRLTESDLVRLVKRVINEQMKISDKPYLNSVQVGGKTLKVGDSIIVYNESNDDLYHYYYGTISDVELDGDKLIINIDGGTVINSDNVQSSMKKKTKPDTFVQFGRNCLRISMPKPESIDTVNFDKPSHSLSFDKLDRVYLMSSESACVSETPDEMRKNLGLSRIR